MPVSKPKLSARSKPEPARDPGRYVSKHRLSQILARNPATVSQWVTEGMPVVVVGDAKAGRDWLIDVAEVVKWREKIVADKARADAGVCGDDPTILPPGHPLAGVEPKDRPMVIQRYVNLALAQKMAVSVNDVVAIWTKAYRDIGSSLMSIPELAARNLRGFPEADVRAFVKAAKSDINSVLRDAAAGQARSIHALTSGGDPYADPDDVADEEVEA